MSEGAINPEYLGTGDYGLRASGLYGKGYYIWQIPKCDGGDPNAIAARAANAGLSHVLIKIADGTTWKYNYDYERKVDLVPPVVEALRRVGVSVWGWHYVRGDNPVAEAQLAVERVNALGLDGYSFDAEGEYRTTEKREAAKRFMHDVRKGLPNLPIALSSYRFPRIHKPLPFAEFLDQCDYAMPQMYFENAHNPEEQLERCVEQYANLRPARPVIPTAPTYASSIWRPTADEIKRMFAKAKNLGLKAANAWSWDFAARTAFIDMFNAVAEFDWPPAPPAADVPEQLIGYWNKHNAVGASSLYRENAAHVTGARTVVGRQAVAQWYETVFGQLLPNARFDLKGKSASGNSRRFTWTAASDVGTVLDGADTLGLDDGRILYHYTYFTIQ